MKVLVAFDDDPVRDVALGAVRHWLREEAQAVVLHVGADAATTMPVGGWPPIVGGGLVGYPYLTATQWPTDEEIDDQAREVAGRAADIVEGRPRTERGDPAEVIVRVATEIQADLIVVGTKDRSWLSRLIQPSVGSAVVNDAPCSVLVVREPRNDQHD